jgi:hypothetical protein
VEFAHFIQDGHAIAQPIVQIGARGEDILLNRFGKSTTTWNFALISLAESRLISISAEPSIGAFT